MRPNRTARNEQRKLLATWLNTLVGATVTVGVLAPAAGILYGLSTPVRSGIEMTVAVAIWLAGGVALHTVARGILRRIEE